MYQKKSLCLVFFLFTPVYLCLAAERNHDIDLNDYFSISFLTDCDSSPDGEYAVYREGRWDKDKNERNYDLWCIEISSHRKQRLTFDPANDDHPAWSPNSEYIYFTSRRKIGSEDKPPYDGSNQIWRINRDGKNLVPITRIKDGVDSFQISANGNYLYYQVSAEKVSGEWVELRNSYKDLEYGHGVNPYSQIWCLNLDDWRVEKIVDEDFVIKEFSLSPDCKHIAMITTPDDNLITYEGKSRIDLIDIETRKITTVTPADWRKNHPSPCGWLSSLCWSNDSQALGFSISFDGYPAEIYVAEWLKELPNLYPLKRPSFLTVDGETLRFRGKSRDLCFIGQEKARQRVYCFPNVRKGNHEELLTVTPGDVVVDSYSYSESSDQLVMIMCGLSYPQDIFIKNNANDGIERLTTINPQIERWKIPQISIVQWTGANGSPVEGILELPQEYDEPLPMIVDLHGGPWSASLYRFQFWIYGRTLLPSKGYAVFCPNYRGSIGYGDQFLVDLIGHENEIEVEDILKGVDAMVERGIADPTRLGVTGWSNGGFLTNCIISKTDRFKAASSGAGVVDQVMQWGVEDTPGHVLNYMTGFPWDIPEKYRRGSPLYNLNNVITPTLIHVGENDARVPAIHAKTLYRALRHYLDIDTELIIYPGEGHGLEKMENRRAKMEWDLQWFDKYVMKN